jgi:hypothetical protein
MRASAAFRRARESKFWDGGPSVIARLIDELEVLDKQKA